MLVLTSLLKHHGRKLVIPKTPWVVLWSEALAAIAGAIFGIFLTFLIFSKFLGPLSYIYISMLSGGAGIVLVRIQPNGTSLLKWIERGGAYHSRKLRSNHNLNGVRKYIGISPLTSDETAPKKITINVLTEEIRPGSTVNVPR